MAVIQPFLISRGSSSKGLNLIKEGWITAELSKSDLKYFRKKYKKYLNSDDYIKRADYLAWENKYWDLKRMLLAPRKPRIPQDRLRNGQSGEKN